MLSYAGVSLVDPDPATLSRLQATLDWPRLLDVERAAWPGGRRLGWAVDACVRDRPRHLNTLAWPRGASRWACGYFLATLDKLQQIRQAVYSQGSGQSSAPFVMADGKRTLQTNLWMLPARPVHQIPGAGQLYVLTLVDDRFYWWQKTGQVGYVLLSQDWDTSIAETATGLGITLNAGGTDGAYQQASPSLRSTDDALPLLLDTLACNTGKRVVRGLDGTVSLQDYATAAQSWQSELSQPLRRVVSGGKFQLTPGPLTTQDLNALVPRSVTFLFQRLVGGAPWAGVYPLEVTLGSLGLPQYAGVTGHPGTQRFADEAVAIFDSESGTFPDNLDALQPLANKFAGDWYLWQLGTLAVELAGDPAWNPDGLHDLVVWTHRPEGLTCRVLRGAWDDTCDQLTHYIPGVAAAGSISRAQPTVADDGGATVVPNTTALLFRGDQFTVTNPYPGVPLVSLAGGGTPVIIIIYVIDITDVEPPYPPPGATYFNCYDQKLYLYLDNACNYGRSWFDLCLCKVIFANTSGSGSGTGCVPRLGLNCANCSGQTPAAWSVTVPVFAQSFCSPLFSRAWTATQLTACSWKMTLGNGAYLLVEVLSGVTIQATFFYQIPGKRDYVALLYSRNDWNGDCCSPVTLPLVIDAGCLSNNHSVAPAALVFTPTCCAAGSGGSGPGGGAVTACCTLGLPTTVYARFSNQTGNCGCIPNGPIALVWDGLNSWTATVNWCASGTTLITLACQATCLVGGVMYSNCLELTGQALGGPFGCGFGATLAPGAYSCTPLYAAYLGVVVTTTASGCCNGTVDIYLSPS